MVEAATCQKESLINPGKRTQMSTMNLKWTAAPARSFSTTDRSVRVLASKRGGRKGRRRAFLNCPVRSHEPLEYSIFVTFTFRRARFNHIYIYTESTQVHCRGASSCAVLRTTQRPFEAYYNERIRSSFTGHHRQSNRQLGTIKCSNLWMRDTHGRSRVTRPICPPPLLQQGVACCLGLTCPSFPCGSFACVPHS